MAAFSEHDESIFHRGAIRSKTVSRLSGASLRQLQYWHKTGLIVATVIAGSRGTPRLYSWIDYMKARAATKLLDGGVPNLRLRAYISWLEENAPDWYKLPLIAFGARAFVASGGVTYEAGVGRQMISAALAIQIVTELEQEGPLGRLRSFAQWVSMDPRIHGGSPVVKGTRLETQYLAQLVERGTLPESIASIHKLDPTQVSRALAFEGEVATAA